jgi:RNA polymerase sigma factor (sigma-70 family)
MNDILISPALEGYSEGRRPLRREAVPADFVRQACLRYVQNRDEADDLTQEVLLKVSRRGSGFAEANLPAGWLYRVAANHCLDHLRRQKRLRGKAETYADEYRIAVRETSPGYGADNDRGREVLEELRAGSGKTDRYVVYLRFDLDLSQSGIAEILGVSRAAVGQRLARIRTRAAILWQQLSREE